MLPILHVFHASLCLCSTVCEEEPSQAKLAWMRVLERYKENECRLSQEEEGTVPDAQLRSTAKTKSIRQKQDKRRALYLVAGQSHSVWTPRKPSLKKQPAFTDVVMEVVRNKQDLQERQKRLRSRVRATQLVLKVQREELEEEEGGGGGEGERVQTPTTEKRMWQKVIKKVMVENTKAKRGKRSKRSLHFHEVVSQYAEKMAKANQNDEEAAESTVRQAKADARRALKQWRSEYLGRSKSSMRNKKPLKPFSSVAHIHVQQPASHHGICNTITEGNEDNSSL